MKQDTKMKNWAVDGRTQQHKGVTQRRGVTLSQGIMKEYDRNECNKENNGEAQSKTWQGVDMNRII